MEIVLYSGPQCSLCHQAEAVLIKVQAEVPFAYRTVDISEDPALVEAYGTRIPVITLDGAVVLEGKVSEFWLRKALAGEPINKYKI